MSEEMRTEIKLLKNITDNLQDSLIDLIINESEQRILSRINLYRNQKLPALPDGLEWIVRDVSIKRFNRLNAEGTKKHSEEGLSFDWESYLNEYEDILVSFNDTKPVDKSRSGVIRMW
ncbi:phage head-tail connector protein [Marinilactibacillus psychrotolerans]|uniref:Phage head-tail connector protein n=1 Tax=Marinilactibacillus psychrotolerans TaxID=191770 RepID=A0A5R9C056_9LACT|nr:MULTISPECIES: phage head-tail connector protein [Marinilactibacillus]API89047.1 hypothetical protein BKP56_07170 [Marinilactibacillus sp. 15R]TLQ06060.1 phage head-tail connector protein [Marinilactibacillus psychrotolerans]